ncbi:MAG: mismatch-specific DNA-glycosylase [Acidimicrobiales bacterium]
MTNFVPLRLRRTHQATPVGSRAELNQPATYSKQRWADVVEGAGFGIDGTRLHSLADTVRPGMTMLVCGLNPSPASSDAGVGFARPGNRFWPAAMAAGMTDIDRDPDALLARGVGMTDLVKRTTRRADALAHREYEHGVARVERLVEWLQPGVVCFVGLAGWRAAIDRKAVAGHQGTSLGGRPAYVMPSTSGLNASAQLPDLVDHLRRAHAIGTVQSAA